MPVKRPIPVALALTALLASPAMAQQQQAQARDSRPNVMQPGSRAQDLELKGPAGEAVGHLKDAYSELAKAHANVVAGKMNDAQDSLGKVRGKLEETSKVKDAPEHIKVMADGLRKRIQELEASLPGRDLNMAAQETGDLVRAMSRDMTNLVVIRRTPARGGGGGPEEPQKEQDQERAREHQPKTR